MGYALDPAWVAEVRSAILERTRDYGVLDADVRVIEDADGETALKVFLVVDDDYLERVPDRNPIRRAVRDVVRRAAEPGAASEIWPYIRFVTRGDLKAMFPEAATA